MRMRKLKQFERKLINTFRKWLEMEIWDFQDCFIGNQSWYFGKVINLYQPKLYSRMNKNHAVEFLMQNHQNGKNAKILTKVINWLEQLILK
jgi:hypothetical protein